MISGHTNKVFREKPLHIDQELAPRDLLPAIERFWAISANKISCLNQTYDATLGSPVFTVQGRYTTRDWTEWTQGFQFGSEILQFDASGGESAADALEKGGLPIAEITLRTDAGIEAIAKLSSRNDFVVGAGTVHSVEQAKMVSDAGAKFVVSPGFNPKTVQWCPDHQIPIYPGVSCPTDLEGGVECNVARGFRRCFGMGMAAHQQSRVPQDIHMSNR